MKRETLNGATWGNRKRRDLPLITPPMMKVLLALPPMPTRRSCTCRMYMDARCGHC